MKNRRLFRLPWSLVDNPNGWIEPTTRCNLSCKGCYRVSGAGDKPLSEVKNDIDRTIEARNCDHIAVAGGEPLVLDHLEDIVRYAKSRGQRVTVLTNGMLLDSGRLASLKEAGLDRITLHVDSKQQRPGWEGKSEKELLKLKKFYVDMISRAGIQCSLISTVFQDTVGSVADNLRWLSGNSSSVSNMTFDMFRYYPDGSLAECYYDSRCSKVPVSDVSAVLPSASEKKVFISDVLDRIKSVFPDFRAHSFLNGTSDIERPKWLLATLVFAGGRHIGYIGARSTEVYTFLYHMLRGRYPSAVGGTSMWLSLVACVFDPETWKTFVRFIRVAASDPRVILRGFDFISMALVQPVDWDADGTQNICDGCPDAILYKGRLVPSCRLDEIKRYDGTLRIRFRSSELTCKNNKIE